MSPAARSLGKLVRARIVPPRQPELFQSVEEQLRAALVPGTSVERYNRLWRLGQVHVEDGFVYGRLGYESASGADIWDEETLDFQETQVPAGVATPFAIRLSDLLLVFQTQSQDIRVTSFTSALQGILREATGNDGWRIETARHRATFEEWRASVRRIVRIRFRIEPPNPNYEGRPDVQRLLEDAEAAIGTIELRADADGSLNTDAEVVRQLLDHGARGYGETVAVGEREVDGQVVETVYDSKLEGESEVVERPVDPATGEASPEVLRGELTDDAGNAHAQ